MAGFEIPNEADAAHGRQSEPSHADLRILALGLAGFGVLDGGDATAAGGMDVAVDGATIQVGGVAIVVTGDTVTLDAADPDYPRVDLIVADSGGVSVIVGSPDPPPDEFHEPPAPEGAWDEATQVVLHAVFVGAAAGSVGGGEITDKRAFVGSGGGFQIGSSYLHATNVAVVDTAITLISLSWTGSPVGPDIDIDGGDATKINFLADGLYSIGVGANSYPDVGYFSGHYLNLEVNGTTYPASLAVGQDGDTASFLDECMTLPPLFFTAGDFIRIVANRTLAGGASTWSVDAITDSLRVFRVG